MNRDTPEIDSALTKLRDRGAPVGFAARTRFRYIREMEAKRRREAVWLAALCFAAAAVMVIVSGSQPDPVAMGTTTLVLARTAFHVFAAGAAASLVAFSFTAAVCSFGVAALVRREARLMTRLQ